MLIQGFWKCLSLQLDDNHDRIFSVKNVKKKEVVSAWQVKKSLVDRHVKYHLDKKSTQALIEKNKLIKKMNAAFVIKNVAGRIPSYVTSNEELQFYYLLGEVALKSRVNPIVHLHVDKRTQKKDLASMKEILTSELKRVLALEMTKTQATINEKKPLDIVVANSLHVDHKMFHGGIRKQLCGIVLVCRAFNVHTKETKRFRCPMALFEIASKGGKTIEKNHEEITQFLSSMYEGKFTEFFSLQGDGAIIKPGLLDKFKSGERKFQHLAFASFMCHSHICFLILNHDMYLTMNDCNLESNLFPNHTSSKGKKICFFEVEDTADEDTADENEFAKQLKRFFDIIGHLDTTDDRNISLNDYVHALQKNLKKRSNHNDTTQNIDYIADEEHRFFGTVKFNCNPVQLQNNAGKKSRRYVDVTKKFVICAPEITHCAEKYFQDKIPSSKFTPSFLQKLAEHNALSRYMISISDSGTDGYNISLFRLLAIISRACFSLDIDETTEYSVLDNELIT